MRNKTLRLAVSVGVAALALALLLATVNSTGGSPSRPVMALDLNPAWAITQPPTLSFHIYLPAVTRTYDPACAGESPVLMWATSEEAVLLRWRHACGCSGAAGGIGTPAAALGALMMGAAYVLTGSVNHSCVEAGTSPHVKRLLAQAGMADVMMAPAADMFEMGVNLQVLKRGTMFPLRARKLYEIYQACDSIEAIPAAERQKLEQQIFRRNLDEVWADCIAFFSRRDPAQIEKAQQNPKRKMALIFRWYLGLATRWGIVGEPGREVDYQIWCGPAMGAFNDWARGTALEQPEKRHVADIGRRIMEGAALLYRTQALRVQGIVL
jgi:PfaD family protein